MKVLHLFSNYKWTGPAEPAWLLCRAERAAGADAHLAVMPPIPGETDHFAARCAEAQVPLHKGFHLEKHFAFLKNARDVARLTELIDRERFRVLHAHLPNAHLVAGPAARRSRARPAVVRTHYGGEPIRRGLRARTLLALYTDGLVHVSEAVRRAHVARLGFPEERTWTVDTSVDLARFDPARPLPDKRREFGVDAEQFLVGVVARVQSHRRFAFLLEGVRRAWEKAPHLRLAVIGRGTHLERLAAEPARRMGLGGMAIFTGYQSGDDYVGTLAALDCKVFLVPGTDGSCRAVREAMAMGKPVVAARRGMLPELVADGETGLLIRDDAQGIAEALVALASAPERARRMGEAGRAEALRRFDPARQAERTLEIYERVLAMGRRE